VKRNAGALAFSALALALALLAAGGAAAPPAPKPDLVITSFGLESWGACTSGQTVFTFSVGLKNQGGATWSGPARPPLVVRDMHLPNPDDWGTGIAIDPPIAPGETRNVKVPIAYYAGNPAHMKDPNGKHPFHATVNGNHAIDEVDFSNNEGPGPATWNGLKVVMVGAPEACLKAVQPIRPATIVKPPAGIATPVPTPAPPR
jgi:hypothetical protein